MRDLWRSSSSFKLFTVLVVCAVLALAYEFTRPVCRPAAVSVVGPDALLGGCQ